jgi:multidrug efflux pump subunit AcrB
MLFNQSTLSSAVLALVVAAADLHAGAPQNAVVPQTMVVVEASYPGANAAVAADTVAAPIEQQLKGVGLHLRSRSTSVGKYILAVTFKPGTNPDKALAAVQKRVALAMPIVPEVVQRDGITVRKKTHVLVLVNLSSPEGRYDTLYLSNYVSSQIQDELARAPGVGDITGIGLRDYLMRIWLDPMKLAAHQLAASDALKTLEAQKVQVAPAQLGQPPTGTKVGPFIVKTVRRLIEPKQLEDIILKTDAQGAIVHLKDVGRVEPGAESSYVSLNGKPGVVLAIYPISGASANEVSRAVADRLAMLRARLPEGLRLEAAFDFTANLDAPGKPTTSEYLLLDLNLSEPASLERMREALKSCDSLLHGVAGVRDVLALSENPFDILGNGPCLLVRLAPREKREIGREEILQTIRMKVATMMPGVALHPRDLARPGAFPQCGYPIDLAVSGPEPDEVRELAPKLAELLRKSKKLMDVWVNRESTPRPFLHVTIDRTQAMDQGLEAAEIFNTLQVFLGSVHVGDFNRFGRVWEVVVQADSKLGKRVEDLKQVKIRNAQGQMIPLANIATVQTSAGPGAINRFDLNPMVQITANPAPGVSLTEARTFCADLFAQMRKSKLLPARVQIDWLQE